MCKISAHSLFQSTRSARSATLRLSTLSGNRDHFNPRAPRGARRAWSGIIISAPLFQSTRSARSATPLFVKVLFVQNKFQSTRSARSATRIVQFFYPDTLISIHALREERDPLLVAWGPRLAGFQSTRSARSATYNFRCRRANDSDFNPRAPRGARQPGISTLHSPTAFQSTRSARSATISAAIKERITLISIHALREERDHGQAGAKRHDWGFQSTRSARSATLFLPMPAPSCRKTFQSTRSARSATAKKHKTEEYFFVINIKYYESFR